jgi:uncharacterized protein
VQTSHLGHRGGQRALGPFQGAGQIFAARLGLLRRGLALLLWGVFTLYMWISTFRSNLGVWSVFLLLWITFFLLAAGDLGMGLGWRIAGGWVGLATGIDALYVSFAEVTNATFGRTVIPLGAPIVN